MYVSWLHAPLSLALNNLSISRTPTQIVSHSVHTANFVLQAIDAEPTPDLEVLQTLFSLIAVRLSLSQINKLFLSHETRIHANPNPRPHLAHSNPSAHSHVFRMQGDNDEDFDDDDFAEEEDDDFSDDEGGDDGDAPEPEEV